MEPEEYGRVADAEDDHWWYANLRALVADVAAPWLPGAHRILDAGCGPGGNSAWLAGCGAVVGVDVSPEALAFLRSRHTATIPVRGSVVALPLADRSFDLVLSLTVLHAVDDDAAAVHELARVLAPRGALLVVEPAFGWLRRAHDDTVRARRRYRRGRLSQLLADQGLVVRRATYAYSFLVPAAAALAGVDRLRARRYGAGAGRAAGSDLERRWLDAVFAPLARAERRVLVRRDVPIGTSVVLVATAR